MEKLESQHGSYAKYLQIGHFPPVFFGTCSHVLNFFFFFLFFSFFFSGGGVAVGLYSKFLDSVGSLDHALESYNDNDESNVNSNNENNNKRE